MNVKTHDNRSKVDQRVDSFVLFFGSLKFITWQTIIIICWITYNVLALTNKIHFDKYPFILLNLVFSTQAAYAAPLILLSQNRQAEIDRQKADHDYEVNQQALTEIKALRAEHAEIKNLLQTR